MGKTINTLSSSSHDLLRVPLAHRKADLLASASAMALLAGSSFIALGPMAAMATLGVAGLLFYRLHTPLETPDTHDTLNQRVLNHFAKKTTTAPLTYGEVGIEDSRHDAIEASLGWVRDNTLTMSQTLRKAMPQAEQNAVLAHEVGHAVYGRMATDFLRAHELVAVAAAVGGVVATTLADQGPTVIQSAALCFNAVAVWGINLAHMRHMERQSDRFSVRLTGTANMANALLHNAANAVQQEPQGMKRTILTLFKDHPYASDRIHLMQQELAKLPEDWKQQRQHELSAIAATAPAYPADDMIPAADKRILQTQEIRTAHPNWATPLRHTAR